MHMASECVARVGFKKRDSITAEPAMVPSHANVRYVVCDECALRKCVAQLCKAKLTCQHEREQVPDVLPVVDMGHVVSLLSLSASWA